jgi:hypothetical protein
MIAIGSPYDYGDIPGWDLKPLPYPMQKPTKKTKAKKKKRNSIAKKSRKRNRK